ncbi:hypothetical protein SUDANB121_02988 [Nocardiopsis dassonvillei]|uniref:hypothetical protein n=1 Tax=Nocardiopsis dassonvillei TaxID=2014 RepID=UPI003F54AA5B
MKFEVVEPDDWDGPPEAGEVETAGGPPAPADQGDGGPEARDPGRSRIERIAEQVNSQVKADIATTRAALGKLWATVAETNPSHSDSRHTDPVSGVEPPPEFRPSAFSPAPRPRGDGGGPG